jgi:polar amino acid transport system substrate-binding protein
MKKLFSTIFLIGLFLVNSCKKSESQDQKELESAHEQNMLIMGVSADYPPFEFIKNMKIIGFDIDLANEIAKDLGFKLYIKEMDFDALISSIESGRVDFAASSIAKTPERLDMLSFSDEYYTPQYAVMFKKTKEIKKLSDLADSIVGVQSGSTMESFIRNQQDIIANMQIISANRLSSLAQDLLQDKHDAIILEEPQAKSLAKKYDNFTYFIIDSHNSGYSIAFPRESELVEKFNQSIKKLKENGKLEELKAKWLADNLASVG